MGKGQIVKDTSTYRSKAGHLLLTLILIAEYSSLYACTSFLLRDEGKVVIGKNYDWEVEPGILVTNMRNMAKTAFVDPDEKPVKWVSKYGSITFNQYGREFPNGGMNEAGLVVETLLLTQAKYPVPDNRPALESLSWVQYQLDSHATVQEVIESDRQIRISSNAKSPVHFMVFDKTGSVAVIEFVSGKFVCHSNDNLPIEVLTNHTYTEAIKYLCTQQDLDGDNNEFEDYFRSLTRFKIAAYMVVDYNAKPSKPIIKYAFDTLAAAINKSTKWTIVYDVSNLEIHFITRRKNKTKIVNLKQFDFNCPETVKMLKLNTDYSGKVDKYFIPYDSDYNRQLLLDNYQKLKDSEIGKTLGIDKLPDAYIEKMARYPETTKCIDK